MGERHKVDLWQDMIGRRGLAHMSTQGFKQHSTLGKKALNQGKAFAGMYLRIAFTWEYLSHL